MVITGRPEQYRRQTERWLRSNGIPFSRLLMRPAGDHRPDYVVKADMLRDLDPKCMALAVDDRPPVCQMLREKGIRVLEVNSDQPNREINELYRVLS